MKTILVSYDLKTPGKDYTKLISFLKTFDDWAKPLESLWVLRVNYNPEEIRNKILPYIDANDRVIVIDITDKQIVWFNLPEKISDWLQNL